MPMIGWEKCSSQVSLRNVPFMELLSGLNVRAHTLSLSLLIAGLAGV